MSIHLSPDSRIVARANQQYWLKIPLSTSRGEILDRNGTPLAVSVPAQSLVIDPLKWKTENAPLLKDLLPASLIRDLSIKREGRFRWVRRKVDPERAQAILDKKLPGLFALKEKERVYPNGELMAHVLGYCDIDDQGLAGSEKYWDQELYSPPSLQMLGRDGLGNPVNLMGIPSIDGEAGSGSTRLTVDARIQHILEFHLKRAAGTWKAKWGAAICVAPETGMVLGMASWPTFDPNQRKTFQRESLRSNVTGRIYEPGSTFKPIIMGMALDRKVVSPKDRFYSPGFIRIADHVIKNYHRKAFGWEHPADILINSCNVGMSQIGMKMDIQSTHGSLRQWGFGQATGIELPGEEAGLLNPPEQWKGVVPANIAIGQGVAVTPLQLAMAISAIANGGHLMSPHLVERTFGAHGQLVYESRPTVKRDVLSPETAQWLRQALLDVVEKGSGRNAHSTILSIAGKTGTAQVAEKGIYAKGRYVTSFVGFWPSDNPKYLVLVVIGEPQGRNLSGGKVAAPVVRQIAEDIHSLKIR